VTRRLWQPFKPPQLQLTLLAFIEQLGKAADWWALADLGLKLSFRPYQLVGDLCTGWLKAMTSAFSPKHYSHCLRLFTLKPSLGTAPAFRALGWAVEAGGSGLSVQAKPVWPKACSWPLSLAFSLEAGLSLGPIFRLSYKKLLRVGYLDWPFLYFY
jgi:hypothetical protein